MTEQATQPGRATPAQSTQAQSTQAPATQAPAGQTADNGAAAPPFRYTAAMAEEIELRWQDRWAASGTFNSPNPCGPLAAGFTPGRPKFYVLDMFPYASGTGIHVGHPIGYIATRESFAAAVRPPTDSCP